MKDHLNWNDLVFENRNKAYGAYNLRNAYSGRVVRAFMVALTILALVMAFPAIRKLLADDEIVVVAKKTVAYTDLAPPPPIDKNTPPTPKVDVPPPVKEVIKFVPPDVTDKEVVEDETPTIDEIKDSAVSSETTDGPVEDASEEVAAEAIAEPAEDPNMVYMVVEQPAEFPGGVAAMMKWVAQNMRYPSQARRMGIEGNVFVQFVIDRQGHISEAKVIKGIGAGCDEEALRVIGKMPAWKPGKQNGKAVKSRFVLPLKFVLGS